jgi:excinuclease ABC subunit C
MRKIFSFRSCKIFPKKACLYGRIKLCPQPCIGKISSAQYQEIIKNIELFLDSRYEELINHLSLKMKKLAENKMFEEAGSIRDQINALGSIAKGPSAASSINELEDLQHLLKLDKLPLRIEAFDISNISGKEATGSLVSFYKGRTDKNNYRRFRIKTVEGIDDYKMLAEVIQRRYRRLLAENYPLPDLVLIDGGRSHLSAADKEIKKLGIKIPLVSIAKDRENLYIKDIGSPLKLNSDTPGLNLIRRMRDEAHRFALAYHHLLRRKKIIGK